MVSTKTQIAGFEFDNCLMNAAGVACMTIEELEGLKTQLQEPLSQRQRLWTFVRGTLSHAIKMFHLVPSTLWACQLEIRRKSGSALFPADPKGSPDSSLSPYLASP